MNEIVNVDDFSQYTNMAMNAPILTHEKELELALRVFHHNDLFAAQEIITSYLRLVISVAREYKNYNLPIKDLIQEGNIGLMNAVHRFDPTKGNKLYSYAISFIRGMMLEYISKNFKPMNIATTKTYRKLFFNLRNMQERKNDESIRKKTAEKLNVTVQDVHTMEERMYSTHTFEAKKNPHDNSDASTSYEEILVSNTSSPEDFMLEQEHEDFIRNNVMVAINDLSDRERDILLSRKFTDNKKTLKELSSKYNISKERVRQLEAKTLKHLENIIEKY